MSTLLVTPFDGTSRVPGASFGASRLAEALRTVSAVSQTWTTRVVREKTKSSALYCRRLLALTEELPCKLMLGGEHLVTFPIIEALARTTPGLRLVVLDAHHDAYDYPLLTHYSLFHYTCHELHVPTLVVGARHELSSASGCEVVSADDVRAAGVPGTVDRIRTFVGPHPVYFSVDVDVLDPGVFPGVSDPVPGGLTIEEVTDLARGVLALSPVAADIVEYNPFLDPRGEGLRSLSPFLKEFAAWLG